MAARHSTKEERALNTIRVSVADMIALRIRARGSSPALPEFLYQSLPVSALSLLTTLPGGNFPVSIPHQRQPAMGFPIEKSPPATAEGWVLVYSLRPDRFYEAVEVLFEGRKYGIEDFRRLASRRVESQAGLLRAIPGRHMYLAPTIELWGAIAADCGYVVADPDKMPAEITPEIRKIREGSLTSGVIARVPFQTSDKLPAGSIAFAQVELALEPQPGPQCGWTGFDEHQKNREARSRPPAAILPDFIEWAERLRIECGCQSWVFRPGMLFGDQVEWWGDGNLRRTLHEGLDFAQGRQTGGGIQSILQGTPVRAMADGEVVSLLDDFLGKTVVVRHTAIPKTNGTVFHTLYSHIQPEIGPSCRLAKGRMLGRVAKSTAAGAPAHLHMTGAWIPGSTQPSEITMERINPGYVPIVLADFNPLLRK